MILVLDGLALTLLIVGGFLGTGSTRLAFLITGFVLVQVTWVLVVLARRERRKGRSSIHRVDSTRMVRDV